MGILGEAERTALVGGTRRVYDSLPEPVQSAVHNGIERIHGRRRREQNQAFLNGIAVAVGGFSGKRVLEVGHEASGALLREIDVTHHAAEAIGINPAFPGRTVGPRSRTEQGDARDTGLADESVDIVYSVSAFEHVRGLDGVLAECHRVLRPGGRLYAHFGPIWSTSYGHHLWVLDQGRLLSYHNVLLPPWCHLLRSREELLAICEPGFGTVTAGRIVDFVLDSPDQNQMFFDDYARIVRDCALETVYFKGYDIPAMASKYQDAQRPEVLDELRARYPERDGFLYDGIVLLLRKPAG